METKSKTQKKAKTAKVQSRSKAPTRASRSTQSPGRKSRQGAGTQSQELRGGTKQVLIEEAVMVGRGGRRQLEETYPFRDLTPSRIENGAIVGPSFFIPETENPKRLIAAGRKRHKAAGKIYLTRQMEGPDRDGNLVSGTRVWLAPPERAA